MNDKGRLFYTAGIDNSRLRADAAESLGILRSIGKGAQQEGMRIDSLVSSLKNGMAALGLGFGFKELSSHIYNTRAAIQSLEISFETLLGNREKASSMFSEIRQFAASTPMLVKDLAQGAQTMLGFGIAADQIMPMLRSIGDISMGNAQNFGSLTLAFSQMAATGKLMGQDLMQMINAGFNPLNEIARTTGKTLKEVKAEQEAGRVTVQMVTEAFKSATSEGGKYFNMLRNQGAGLEGATAQLQGAVSDAFNEMGQHLEGFMATGVSAAKTVVQHWEEAAMVLAGFAASFGLQKAYDTLSSVAATEAQTAAYGAQMEVLSGLLPQKEAEKLTDLQLAVAKGELTEAQATAIASTRAEVQARLEALAVKEEEARQNVLTSQSALTTALQEKETADRLVASCTERRNACYDMMDAVGMEAAGQELATARTLQAEAADSVAAATKEARAAASEHVAIQTQRESVATGLNTAQTAANTAATNILIAAKNQLTAALRRLWAAMTANPLMLVAAGVTALGYAIYKVCSYQTEYEKGLERLNDASRKCEQGISGETHEIDRLFGKLEQARKGTEEWEKARDSIWAKYGQYLKSLGDEKTALNDVAKAYSLVKEEALKAARARAMDAFAKSEGEAFASDMGDLREKAYQLVVKKKGQQFADRNYEAIMRIVEGNSQVDPAFLASFDEEKTSFMGVAYKKNELEDLLGKARKRRKANDDVMKEAERRFGPLTESESGAPDTGVNLDKAFRQATLAFDEAKAKVARMDADRAKYTVEEYEAATGDLKKAKEELEKLGGKTKEKKASGPTAAQLASRAEGAGGKLADLIRRQDAERERIEQDCEMSRRQTRIDLMREGTEKVIGQMKLDFEKERLELERRKKQEIEGELNRQLELFNAREEARAKADRRYAKRTFRDSDISQAEFDEIERRYTLLQQDLTATQDKALSERGLRQKEALQNYLSAFGTYARRRRVIEEQTARKAAEAPTEGERISAIAEGRKAQADLDFEQWQKEGPMALAFGDISKLSRQTVSSLIQDLERYRERFLSTFDPEKIEKYEQALASLRDAEAKDGFFFASEDMLEPMRERLSLQRQLAGAEADEAALAERKRQLAAELTALLARAMQTSADTSAIDPAGESITPGAPDEETKNRIAELRALLMEVEKSIESSGTRALRLREQLKSLGQLRFGDIERLAGQVAQAGRNASELASVFSGGVGEALATAAETAEGLFSAFTDISGSLEKLTRKAEEAVEKGADATEQVVEGVADGMKSSAATAADAISTVEKASAILTVISAAIRVATLVASLFPDPDRKHEERIEELQKSIDRLKRGYDSLGKAVEEAFSSDAARLIAQQQYNLQRQQALLRAQLEEEQAKRKSDDGAIQDYKDRIADIADQLRDLRTKAEDAIFGSSVKSQIEQFADAYADAWSQAGSRAMAARDMVRDMMRQMVSESLKAAVQSSGAMDRIRRQLADYFRDGVFSAYEREQAYAMATDLQRQLDEVMGQNAPLFSQDSFSQSVSPKAWGAMTSEDAGLLQGRFSALAETGESIRQINAGIAEGLRASLEQSRLGNDLLQDALNVQIISMGHLEAISSNTRRLAVLEETLAKIERHVRQL